MQKELYTNDKITIDAPVSEVWDALTNPEKTINYMYGCKVETDWRVGGQINWIGAKDEIVYVKGNLTEIEKNNKLAFTTIDPNGKYKDVPGNYLTVTYTLISKDGSTGLMVTQGDYANVEEGRARYEDTISNGGWAGVLEKIKTMVEEAK